MKLTDLKLTWLIGRGYGDAFCKEKNVGLREGLQALDKHLREKYGVSLMGAMGRPERRSVHCIKRPPRPPVPDDFDYKGRVNRRR